MASVRGAALRWVSDEPQPGWVEVELRDANGAVHSLFDKPPIFESASVDLRRDSPYPVPVEVQCRVIGAPDEDTLLVEVEWTETADGRNRFVVRASDVTV